MDLPFEKYFKYIYLHKFYQPPTRVRKEVYLEQKREMQKQKLEENQKDTKGKQKAFKKEKKQKNNHGSILDLILKTEPKNIQLKIQSLSKNVKKRCLSAR